MSEKEIQFGSQCSITVPKKKMLNSSIYPKSPVMLFLLLGSILHRDFCNFVISTLAYLFKFSDLIGLFQLK